MILFFWPVVSSRVVMECECLFAWRETGNVAHGLFDAGTVFIDLVDNLEGYIQRSSPFMTGDAWRGPVSDIGKALGESATPKAQGKQMKVPRVVHVFFTDPANRTLIDDLKRKDFIAFDLRFNSFKSQHTRNIWSIDIGIKQAYFFTLHRHRNRKVDRCCRFADPTFTTEKK